MNALIAGLVLLSPELAGKWLVLGETHQTPEQAARQAREIRGRHYPDATSISTDHFDGLPAGLHAVVLSAHETRRNAAARVRGIRNLGHRTWTRHSGNYVNKPKTLELLKRGVRLALERTGTAFDGSTPPVSQYPPQYAYVTDARAVGELLVGIAERTPIQEDESDRFFIAFVRVEKYTSALVASADLGAQPCKRLRVEKPSPPSGEVTCAGQKRRFVLGHGKVRLR